MNPAKYPQPVTTGDGHPHLDSLAFVTTTIPRPQELDAVVTFDAPATFLHAVRDHSHVQRGMNVLARVASADPDHPTSRDIRNRIQQIRARWHPFIPVQSLQTTIPENAAEDLLAVAASFRCSPALLLVALYAPDLERVFPMPARPATRQRAPRDAIAFPRPQTRRPGRGRTLQIV